MTRFHSTVRRADKPHKVMTAKKMLQKKKQTREFREYKEKRAMLRDKPFFRGWLHVIAFPFSIATSVILICLAPAGLMKVGVSIYGATIMLLFGTSAALHLGHGHFPNTIDSILCKIDYSNIFLVIAGTCTPFLFALENKTVCWIYFCVIWATAIIGTLVHLAYPVGLDWLFTIVYIILGLAPVTIIHLFFQSPYIGVIPTVLVLCGGACYIAGAVCFALRKPNPWPKWFGFHELFHLGTIGGYVCHVIAIFMVILKMR